MRFLAKLAQSKLPVSEGIQESVREIVLLEQEENWQLYGKTGWKNAPDPGVEAVEKLNKTAFHRGFRGFNGVKWSHHPLSGFHHGSI